MQRYLSFIALLLLAGCTTLPPLSDGVTLSIRSYDPATGDYKIELRNETSRPILYLSNYQTFHTIRSPDPEPFPDFLVSPDGLMLMIHNTRLDPGHSIVFSGTCTESGLCDRPQTYVAVRACWFKKSWDCEQYFPIWSKTPISRSSP
ncbi:hypothetical protein [Stenotrophomonas sp. PS02289]|uniref:hypothetical protein n=1 Tax=Stenotrophomonas sp. PS02289 TaxID=2991422 RepID=UPI00249AED6E|nr:hypothetical protein [Stenotrophomonas sp. PS02289]